MKNEKIINEETGISLSVIFIILSSALSVLVGSLLWLTSIQTSAYAAEKTSLENKKDIKKLNNSNAKILTHLEYIIKGLDELKKSK